MLPGRAPLSSERMIRFAKNAFRRKGMLPGRAPLSSERMIRFAKNAFRRKGMLPGRAPLSSERIFGKRYRCRRGMLKDQPISFAENRSVPPAKHAELLLQSTSEGVLGIDLERRCTFINPAAASMIGWRQEDVLGKNIHELLHHRRADGSTYPDAECPLADLLRTAKPCRIEGEVFWRRDGSSFDVEYSASPIIENGVVAGAVVWFTDITARRQDEEALRIARERITIVLEGADVGLWYCPLPFGRLEWDRRVKEHFWLPPEAEVSIDTFYERLHPEDRERTRQMIASAIQTHSTCEIEYRAVSPVDGREKWVRAIGRPFYDAQGKPVRFDGLSIDITGAKQADVEREELLASERAARTEAERTSRIKDEFLATLSHELRTPLNAILGWAQILRSGNKIHERDLQEGLAVIERNARVQTQLIEDLLDMSRIISGKVRLDVQHVDLTVVIEAAVDAVAPTAAAKGIRLQKVLDSRAANTVMGDAARLQQIFWNLLTNAIKFTPRHGRVQIFLQRAGSHIEVSVRDTGQGIKPEFLPHLFERFRQADASTTRKQGGLGLGLALVKSLTEMHGGTVHVKSRGEGQGSTFSVRLPLAIIHSDEGESPDRQSSAPAGTDELFDRPAALKKAKILVIDDEPDARAIVKRMLEECEATVSTAGSAAEGLKLVRQVRPDVLVCDIGMPGEDGYQLIRNVRRLGPEAGGDVPAVALTALARSEDRRRAIVAGFDMHVTKPVEAGEFIAVVARLAHRI
jgi:PAS domain S-box-containing protein